MRRRGVAPFQRIPISGRPQATVVPSSDLLRREVFISVAHACGIHPSVPFFEGQLVVDGVVAAVTIPIVSDFGEEATVLIDLFGLAIQFDLALCPDWKFILGERRRLVPPVLKVGHVLDELPLLGFLVVGIAAFLRCIVPERSNGVLGIDLADVDIERVAVDSVSDLSIVPETALKG